MKNKYIVFDLDDTLCNEIDFLKSAYAEIATILAFDEANTLCKEMLAMYGANINVFEELVIKYPNDISMDRLLSLYRNHQPHMNLKPHAKDVLLTVKEKGYSLGLITDGRSITQRNKLESLGILSLFDLMVISEEMGTSKPNENNYKAFMDNNHDAYYYIGDNTSKDFITANRLGWKTICLLDQGDNIHAQLFDIDPEYWPQYKINQLDELIPLLLEVSN